MAEPEGTVEGMAVERGERGRMGLLLVALGNR
jgi:hypothetical protein